MASDTTTFIYLAGDSAQFAAAMDEGASSAETAAGRIDEAFAQTGGSASSAAADISASFDSASAESSAAIAEASAKMDASFESSAAAAAASSDEIKSTSAETAAAMAESTAAAGDGMVEDLGSAGAAAGMAARDGVASESEGMAEDLGKTGEDAGTALTEGVASSSAGMAEELSSAGILAGGGMASGVHEGASGIEDDLAETGEEGGARLAEGAEGGGERVKSMLGNLGIPESLLGGWTGLGAGIAAVGAVAIDFGEKMQSADTAIANSAGISTQAAKAIGTAFLATAGTTEFSGKEMAEAFAPVAGQLKSTEGAALSTSQSMSFMSAASALATAKQIALKTATSTLGAVMQSYSLKVKTATSASDILYEAANATGQSVTSVGNALDKVKTKLGGLAPSLGTISGLLVDMTDHGETGRAAMSSLTTAFTTFLKPAATMTKAQTDMNVAFKDLTPTLQGYAEAVKNGTMSVTQLTQVSKNLTTRQKTLLGQFTSAYTASITAGEGYQKMGITALEATGKLRPMKTIIGQLHKQITGMSTAQATAQLTADGFGSSASKLVKVIQAGPAAFDKATSSVTKMGTAATGAAKQGGTMHVELKTVESTASDLVTRLGQDLIPVVSLLEHGFVFLVDDALIPTVNGISDVVHWFMEASPAALAVAGVIGGMLVPVIVTMGANAVTAFAEMVGGWATSAASSVADSATQIGSWLGIGSAAETAAGEVEIAAGEMGSSAETAAGEIEAAATEMDTAASTAGAGMAGLGADTAALGTEDAVSATEGIEGVSGSLGGMLGPAGLALGVVGGLAGAFVGLLHSGPTAAQAAAKAVTTLNKKLGQMPTGTVVQMGTDLLTLAGDIAVATGAYGKLAPASVGFTVAGAKIEDLTAKSIGLSTASTTLGANVKTLSTAYGINAAAVQQVAQAAGVTLKKSLDAAYIRQFTAALKTSGVTYTQVKVKAKTFATTTASSAKQAVAAAKANDPLLAQSAMKAMELRVAIMQKTGATAIADLVNTTRGGLPALQGVADQFGITIPQNAMQELHDNLTSGGNIAMSGLETEIGSHAGAIQSRFHQVPTLAGHAMTTTDTKLSSGATKAMSDLEAVLDDPQGKVKSSMVGSVSGAVQALTSHWTDLHGTGTKLMAGLAKGIESGRSAAINAAVNAIDAAVSAAQAKAQIKSPSAVMANTVGIPLMQGIAVGILDGVDGVTSAAHIASMAALAGFGPVNGGAAAIAGRVAAGGTSRPGLIGGTSQVAGGTGGGTMHFHITVNNQGSLTNAQELADHLAPLIANPLRTELLTMQRGLGGPTRVTAGLGFVGSH